MNITSEFSSLQNKHFLWDFITKNKWFDNIPNARHTDIKNLFEKTLVSVGNNHSNISLVEYNKLFLTSMKSKLQQYKVNKKEVSFSNIKDVNVNTIEEEQKGRQLKFNKELKAREDDFISLINRPTPKSVDFKDINRELKIKNMEDHIEKIVEERNLQINSIFKDDKNNEQQKDSYSLSSENLKNPDVVNDGGSSEALENTITANISETGSADIKEKQLLNTSIKDETIKPPIIEIPLENIITDKNVVATHNNFSYSSLNETIISMNKNIATIMNIQNLILEKLENIKII